MKVIPIALAADYASPPPYKHALGIAFTRRDGVVKRGTSHDRNVPINGGVYLAAASGKFSDMQSSSDLAPDNSEFTGMLGAIFSDDELRAGIYDYTAYELIRFNYEFPSYGFEVLKVGKTAGNTIDRITFIAELRGLAQALQQSFGRITTPTCPYILGDTDCKRDLTDLKVTGTADNVSADGLTWRDSARIEAGPGGAISITAITNANPCVATTASAVTQAEGTAVLFSGITDMTALNGLHAILNKSGNTFELNVDTSNTSDFPAYGGGGSVEPIVASAGTFGYGLHKITSGANAGISVEIKVSTVGQWTNQENFPYPVTGTETYELTQGCNKTTTRCIELDNLDNMGGYPFVPGQDSNMEVGRRQ